MKVGRWRSDKEESMNEDKIKGQWRQIHGRATGGDPTVAPRGRPMDGTSFGRLLSRGYAFSRGVSTRVHGGNRTGLGRTYSTSRAPVTCNRHYGLYSGRTHGRVRSETLPQAANAARNHRNSGLGLHVVTATDRRRAGQGKTDVLSIVCLPVARSRCESPCHHPNPYIKPTPTRRQPCSGTPLCS